MAVLTEEEKLNNLIIKHCDISARKLVLRILPNFNPEIADEVTVKKLLEMSNCSMQYFLGRINKVQLNARIKRVLKGEYALNVSVVDTLRQFYDLNPNNKIKAELILFIKNSLEGEDVVTLKPYPLMYEDGKYIFGIRNMHGTDSNGKKFVPIDKDLSLDALVSLAKLIDLNLYE